MASVSKDLVRFMNDGKGRLLYDFLVRDPSFAQDFAPNGASLTRPPLSHHLF